jgi:peptidoglycan/xylan/chitin deacetylase (PgdA/CDA1 family)
MTKKLFIALLTLLLIIPFYGCSKNTTSTQQTPVKHHQVKKISSVQKLGPSFDKNAPMKQPGEGVPVLMYHSVADTPNNPIIISPAKLDQEMKYLKDNGYYTISLDDLYAYFTNNTPIPQKSVVLTFDDGYKDNYTAMFPIMKKYGFRATVFVITAYIDKLPGYLTSQQLKDMQAYGIDIESHTVNHKPLKELPKDQQLQELTQSKAFIETLLNKKVNYIAYPDGSYNKDTVECAEEAGYTMAFTTDGRWSMKKNGLLTLDRDYIGSQFDMSKFIDRITNPNYKFTY